MKVANAINIGVDPLLIATTITLWVLIVDLSRGVEWLVQVADVVNDEAEGEGPLIGLLGEAVRNLLDIGASFRALTLQERCEVGKGAKHVRIGLLEVIVIKVTTFIQVRLIDEVPVALPAVAHALDVVGESGALSEGMVALVLGQ